VILTSTALAELPGTSPDVCIVRLLVAPTVAADVNLDRVIDALDTRAVLSSPLFSPNASEPSRCTDLQPCGRVDVNNDGSVNMLDVTSISQSLPLGTPVPCGALYATAFSCGSTRKAPMTPALQISIDAVNYGNDEGQMLTTVTSAKRSRRLEERETESRMCGALQEIAVEVEGHRTELRATKRALEQTKTALAREIETVRSMSLLTQVMVGALTVALVALVASRLRNK